jgi:FkbM family methyltransferase
MRRLLSRISGRVGWAFTGLSGRLYRLPAPAPTPQEAMVALWFEHQGDKTLRVDYDLGEGSLVFDLGGYEGQWASDIFSRYCCTVHVFEPVEGYAEKIERRFAKNRKIVVHRHGLASENETVKIAVSRDGSSIFKSAEEVTDCVLVKASDFMRDNAVSKIDLMKINIEGGEYDLLEHLIDSGFVKNIKDIQVQFHDFVPDAEPRMSRIQRELEKTHYLTYQYRFVWENWRLGGVP